MKCPKCQFANREIAKFCNECGYKFELECPECGTKNRLESKFCDQCGHDFRKAVEDPAIDYTQSKSYTPKHLADKILTTRSSLEGERKIVTVLFADVANYTSMSEKLDPEEVLQIMDGAFKIMMDETHKYEGTINQFTGDGIMAIFGAPVAHENHAQRACYTALSIQKAMANYSGKIEREYGFDFKIRIGINSGPVIVSAIGDDLRMDYTAVGDTTNLASRMESQAEPGTVLVSVHTHKITERYFDFNFMGKTEVKGKEEPQNIYELLTASEVVTRIEESIAIGLTRFVGRKNSMASLMEAYELVKSGVGQVVGVVGEAGVGKSRLILELQNRLPENEYTYLEGQCLQYGGSILYKPILDILRTFFDIKDDDREFVIKKKIEEQISVYKNLKHSTPAFQDLLSAMVDDESFLKLEPKQKREKIFEAIRDLLISISQDKPLVMVVEDLHWIDDTSEDFIDYLIEWIASTPILLILLYRTEYQHKWSSKTYYRKIGLDHLRRDSSMELVKAMLEGADVDAELSDLILNRAAGNPLFMEEFTRTLIENGTIRIQDSQYVLSQKISDLHVPDTVQGIIAARMDRLEENLKRTMQVASVIGRDFAFRILQTITGMREDLKSYLLNLQGLEFIYEKKLFPELEYIFKHALTQEVAYNSLLLKRRKQIHENIGRAIEELYTERLEEFYEMLAYHYSRSDNLEYAAHYLKLSGEKAWRNFSTSESYKFFQEALGIYEKLPKSEKNKKTLMDISRLILYPMVVLGFPNGSLEILQKGEKISNELNDKKNIANFCGYTGTYFAYQGKPKEGTLYLESKIDEARRKNDIGMMVYLSFGLIHIYMVSGDFFKLADISYEIISLIEKNNRKREFVFDAFDMYPWLCCYCGFSLGATGKFDEGKLYFQKSFDFYGGRTDEIIVGIFELHYAQFYEIKCDGKKTIEHAQKAIKILEKANWKVAIALAFYSLGNGHLFLGDLDAAQSIIEKGFLVYKEAPTPSSIVFYPLLSSHIQYELGNLTKAQNLAKEALELTIKINMRNFEGMVICWMGRIKGKKINSSFEDAEKEILKGINIMQELNLKPMATMGYFFLGELYADNGRKDEALTNLNKALSMCQEMGIGYWPDKIHQALDRL